MSPQNSSARRRSGSRTVYAAGAVLWRPVRTDEGKGGKTTVEIAVIHRPRYDDWSLPKGKVDPGETAPVAAAREILEETGHRAILGRRLVSVSYPIDQGVKKVCYWAARSTGGSSPPVTRSTIWSGCRSPDAMKKLDYAQDRKVLRRFAKYPPDTHTVLVVRHGTAGSKARYSGDDTKRPLDKGDVRRPRHWLHSCWPSAPPACIRPTGCAATRRWNPSPQNWMCRSETRPP